MELQSSKKDDVIKGLAGKSIYIIGNGQFQNELLAFYLEKETGAKCTVREDFSDITAVEDEGPGQSKLIPIEYPARDLETFLSKLEVNDKLIKTHCLVALFNVNHGHGVE